MRLSKLIFLLILIVIQFLDCNSFIDPYDENAKVYLEDGHITFESAHNKDINFKSNFGSIKLNGVQIQDLLKHVKNYKNDNQLTTSQPSLVSKLNQQLTELKDKLKNYDRLQEDVKDLKDTIKQMLNDNKIKPDKVYQSVSGYKKIRKLFDKFKDLMDVDECKSNPCKNGASCLDLFGDYVCQCNDGWSGKDCSQDVDECKLYYGTSLGCQNNAQCINTPGSYHCICKNNYQGTHCTTPATSANICSQSSNRELCGHGLCMSMNNSSYTCICDPGWKKEATSPACTEDIDECQLHKEWAQKILVHKETDLTNFPKQICSIKPLVECHNSLGSFHCGECPKGYQGNGQICIDVNECETNNGGCSTSPYVQCINTVGSRVCGSCPEYYTGDGITCTLKGYEINFDRPPIYNSDVYYNYDLCPSNLNPCLNEGICYIKNNTDTNKLSTTTPSTQQNKDDFYCLCDPGFTGKLCETVTNYCVDANESNQTSSNQTSSNQTSSSGPCKNEGSCYSLIDGFLCICKYGWAGDTCENWQGEMCGTEYRSDNGTIKFPNVEYVLQPGKTSFSCDWKIDTVVGKAVEINLKNLSLDYSPSCMDQYLKISDGIPGLTEHRQLAKLCGNLDDLPKNSTNITSEHNFVTIQFFDNNWPEDNTEIDANFGFKLDFRTVEPKCGGLIENATHGSISSPGYPVGYPHFSDCTWILKAKFNKRIQLYFADLRIEEDGGCVNDYVEIIDGELELDPSLGKFCNTTIPAPIISSGPFVKINFISDAFSTDKGFYLTYNAISSVENCGGLYTSDKGHVNSPLFPIKYTNNLECLYSIRLKGVDDKIKLKIEYLELEDHKSCKFDYVEIFDGPDEFSKSQGRLCSNKSVDTIFLSSTNVVLIKFRTDKTFTSEGFLITYEKFCNRVYTEKQGVIKSVNYPKSFSSGTCIYHINVTENNLIKIEFQDFDLLPSDNCTLNSLIIAETLKGADSDKSKFCGNTLPDPYISRFNQLFIITDFKVPVPSRGFKLNYSTIDVECGGILDKSPGFFSSPSKNGQTYRSNSKCNWLIRAGSNQIIKLTFNTFSIEKHSTCKFDYVKVLDSDFNEIGKFCGNEYPPLIQSMTNELVVQFASDKSTELEGFSASFVFTDSSTTCGGHLAQTSGEITSPGFYTQKRYSSNLNCEWHIATSLNKQIRLNFTFLELESNDCVYDKIEIHNGPEVNSPLLATVCGHLKPPIITSHSNELTIVFKTDSNKEAKGFKLTYDTALSGCGGLINSASGSISSPNYPRNYNHNAACDYLIYVAQGSTIDLNFVEIDIEPQDECQFDYVELFDGKNEFFPKIGRYCNLHSNPGTLKSTTNAVLVRFRSDATYGKKGFLLNYLTNCKNMNINGYRGIIESLNFPYPYFGLFSCSWKISVPRGNKINLIFTNLALEDENKDCSRIQFDIDEMINGEIDRNQTKRLCNSSQITDNILNFNTSSNSVQISFKRNELTENPASLLRLEWNLVGCGGEFLYKPSGQIVTPGYPNKVHNYELDCVWHILTTPNNRIILNVVDFDISTGGKCVYGYVKIFSGPNQDSPEIGKICEKPSFPVKLTSSGSSMTIVLKNGLGISGKGLNAMFSIDRNKGCGGQFTLNEGVIQSPNYPSFYDSSDDCLYKIESSELKQIQIKIEDLKFPSMTNCSGGELLIYNGQTINSPLLRRECGEGLVSGQNDTITSTSNKVLVRFKANGHSVNRGFKLSYKMICGGTVILRKDQNYLLKSANYPFFSNTKHPCSYIFTCDYDQKMAVTITHLEPANNYFLTSSSLKFLAGQSADAPVINSFSKSIPSTFVTPGNGMTVVEENIVFRLQVDTLTNACGGAIRVTNEGEFSSPGFPNNYPLKIQCDWVLKTGHSNRISLEFLDFKLQSSDFCNLDYLEIRDTDAHGKLIGRFCGHDLPEFDSQHLHALSQKESNQTNYEMGYNRLWIRFKSENVESDAGFRIKYSLVKEVYLTEENNTISSSQYPSVNVAEEGTVWHISTPETTVISVTIKKLQLTMLRDSYCLSSLIIFDGFEITSGTILKRICGFEAPDQPIVSSGNQMTIAYNSHGMSLFLLEYKSINKFYYEMNKTQIDSVSDSNCSEEIFLGQNDIEKISITSPNYPNGYANNLNCTWIIRSKLGKKIMLTVDDLDIEGVSCYYDKLVFYDKNLNDETFVNQTICGRKSNPTVYLSSSNYAKIEFSSDSVGNGTGFKLTASTQWGGYLIGKSRGVLKFNAERNDNFKTSWIISVKPNRKMQLNFDSIKFGNQPTNDCVESFVLIRDGPSINSPILGKYCNRTNEVLKINETSSNQVYVTFFALRGLYQTFSLNYKEIRVGCVEKYKLETKDDFIMIQSPNYPEPPVGVIECDWTFLSLPSTSIRIDFKILNSNIPCNLSEQAISIYNGGSVLSPLLTRNCPRISSVFSTENMMHVNYVTSGENLHAAFQAKVQIAVCGGTYIIKQRVLLKSKNYPGKYLNNLDCKYYFHSQYPLFSIRFKITKLDLANNTDLSNDKVVNNTDCENAGDFLEVRDQDQDGPVLNRFCGSNSKKTFVVKSYSSRAFVQFKTDSERVGNGFLVEIDMINEKCGKLISDAAKGVIRLGFNSEFVDSKMKVCKWEIVAPKSNRIELTFKKVNLKSDPTNQNACIDTLNFYAKPVTVKYKNVKELNVNSQCNFAVGQKIVAYHNSLSIDFKTPGLGENEGFIIEYDAMKEALCGGELTEQKGTMEMSNEYLLSKNLPVNIGDSISCLWYINPDLSSIKNYTFVLKIEKLEMPDPVDTDIMNAYKNLKNGTNVGSIMKAQRWNLDPALQCENNSVLIGISQRSFNFHNFFLDLCSNLTGKNMFYLYPYSSLYIPSVFSYMVVGDQPKSMKISYLFNNCGSTYHTLGTFSSPNYGTGSNYGNDLICVYKIELFNLGKLQIEFNDFDLEDSPDCLNDYVEILNGGSVDRSPSLGKFCGKKTIKPFITSRQVAVIIFKTNSEINAKGFQFTVTKYQSNQTCGSDYDLNSVLLISSPLYPHAYKNNQLCQWVINAQPYFHIKIVFFARFDIEDSINCTNDYLLIEEKEADNKWKYVNKFCGIKLPDSIKTGSNSVRITFRTNENITSDGFSISVSRQCGRTFDSESAREGFILSPNYPLNYETNLNCVYTFNRTKNEFIVLKLEDWEVTDCPNDSLVIIRDKDYDSSTVISTTDNSLHSHINSESYAKVLGPLCGESKPPPLLTSVEFLKLVFKTDGFKSSKGFKFSYKIVECGKDFNGTDVGIIKSPNIQRNGETSYIHNADCYWNIEVEENHVIVLRFEQMDIESCGRFCHCDFLEIGEISASKKLVPIAKLCGHERYPIIKSNSNSVRLHFRSDFTGVHTGFKLIFKKAIGEKLGCGGTILVNQTGYIKSVNLNKADLYEKNLDCIWTLTANDKQVIRLTFEEFSLEEKDKKTKKCRDYLQINDGSSSAEPLIDILCGSKPVNRIQSSSNRLFLYFKTDDLNEAKGFKIKYEIIEHLCGQQISITNDDEYLLNSNGTILSPNYPQSYPDNIRCRWSFSLPFYLRLELNILEFNLNCTNNDYLQFSLDKRHENLIKICTHSDYLSNSRFLVINGLWLVFKSGQGSYDNNLLLGNKQQLTNQKGNEQSFRFKISYKILNCNSSYTAYNGLILSPKYPSYWTSQNSEICKFTIETQIGRTISLYFNELLIGKNLQLSVCNENRMEIKDGKAANSRKLAVICGFNLPNPIFSSSNVLSFYVRAVNTFNKYSLYYTTTDQGIGCGGNLTSFNGSFYSPLYPNVYKTKKTCIWNIHSLGQNKLAIKFDTFEFNSSKTCDQNYLEIFDGELMNNRTLVKRLCGGDRPADYLSDSNFLVFKLTVNSPNDGVKFKISYNINTLKSFNNQIFTSQNNKQDFFLPNDANSLIGN